MTATSCEEQSQPVMAFFRGFVCQAVELWRERPNVPVLAACAIAQLDILAEVVVAVGRQGATPRDEVNKYRRELEKREPALARVRNAHDSHKHGLLFSNATRDIGEGVSQGQRPLSSRGTAFFANTPRRHFIGRGSSMILLNDGTPMDVGVIISEAVEAWERELRAGNFWIDNQELSSE